MSEPGLGSLEDIYAPSGDVAGDARWFADVFGAEVRFAIDDGGTRVFEATRPFVVDSMAGRRDF